MANVITFEKETFINEPDRCEFDVFFREYYIGKIEEGNYGWYYVPQAFVSFFSNLIPKFLQEVQGPYINDIEAQIEVKKRGRKPKSNSMLSCSIQS